MENSEHLNVEHLIWDESFREWVLTPTRETEVRWERWLRLHPDKTEAVAQARELLLAMRVREQDLTDNELESLIQRTVAAARQTAPPSRATWRLPALVTPFRYAAAAIVLVMAVWIIYPRDKAPGHLFFPDKTSSATTRENHTTKPQTIRLPDGSTVILQPGSRLQYNEAPDPHERAVMLTGEAFFEVQKDEHRPFLVTTGDMITKVLGTSFWVRSFPWDTQASVVVRTGRVAVFPREPLAHGKSELNARDSTVLTPNQQVVFSRGAGSWRKSLVAHPEPIKDSLENIRFVYDETPVTVAFRELEAAYGIHIEFEEQHHHCPVTAAINGLPMYEQLRMLCKIVGASYVHHDGIITVKGSACK